eukprot:1160559-Pelagomonas_calceolata.AAC.8
MVEGAVQKGPSASTDPNISMSATLSSRCWMISPEGAVYECLLAPTNLNLFMFALPSRHRWTTML